MVGAGITQAMLALAMKRAPDAEDSPLRRHAADALRRARKLPIGHERNDLRQLAMGLLWLERKGLQPMIQDRLDCSAYDQRFPRVGRPAGAPAHPMRAARVRGASRMGTAVE
jgi:hypothetical protein